MSNIVAQVLLGGIFLLATSSARAATLTRGPYLQLLTTSSVTVVWNTDAPAECGLAVRDSNNAITTVTGPLGTVCALPLSGLATGATYGYTPLADGIPVDNESAFRTDDPTRPFAFLVVGDGGCGCLPQLALADRMQRTPHDFLLSTGDMIYEDGRAEDFDPKFFGPYRELLRRAVLWPLLGNHDVRTAGGAPWRDAFYTPANNLAHNEGYYSFDFGNAHVAVIDSNTSTAPGSAQYQFLDSDLAASPARWKFVAFHHSIYSSGAHKSNATIQANLVPLFDRNAVDIVFMGHDHDYERTRRMRANKRAPGVGIVYVTTGGGGKSITPVGHSSFTSYAEASFHFVRVAVRGDVLKLHMIRDDGSIGDTLTLTKGGAIPDAPFCGDGLVDQATEECDGDDTAACLGDCQDDCRCGPVCGDGAANQPSEACDGGDDTACPGQCRADCSCGASSDFVTLAPTGDTFIESGTGAGLDHGRSTGLAVDAKPAGIAYFRFDLSGVTAPVSLANLSLYCINGAADGGSFYAVADSSWVEGNGDGTSIDSSGGPGLTWNDVDTNTDLRIDALDTSPYVPDLRRLVAGPGSVVARQSYSIDVTSGFRAGPGVYTLALTSLSRDGAVYASREAADPTRRPSLRLQLGIAAKTTTTSTSSTSSSSTSTSSSTSSTESTSTSSSTSTTEATSTSSSTSTSESTSTSSSTSTTESTSTSSSTSTTESTSTSSSTSTTESTSTSSTSSTTSTTAPPRELDRAPSADTYVENGVQATWEHGGSDHLDVDFDVSDITYLTFDLRDQTGTVLSATLTLSCTSTSRDGGTVYPVADSGWVEGARAGKTSASAAGLGLKWTDVDTNGDGLIDALDTSPFVPDFATPLATVGPVVVGQEATTDLTAAFQSGPGLYSFAIRSRSRNGATYSSRNHPDPAQRPRLHLVVQ